MFFSMLISRKSMKSILTFLILSGFTLLMSFKSINYCYSSIGTFPKVSIMSQKKRNQIQLLVRKNGIPPSFEEVLNSMEYNLNEINSKFKKISVDVLTPGLDPKLEQKAMLQQEYIFQLALSVIEILLIKSKSILARDKLAEIVSSRNILIAFPSAGDAAGFQKYCFMTGYNIRKEIVLTDVLLRDLHENVGFVACIGANNNVGDPVIRNIQKRCEEFPTVTFVFVNCDFGDKVATGMKDRKLRDEFRSSIEPCFYFRNIVDIIRPSLVPIEVGALVYTIETGWEIHFADPSDIVGPGSLNRFMLQGVFKRKENDPTSDNPPIFVKVASYPKMPSREEIDTAISKCFARPKNFRGKKAKHMTARMTIEQAREVLRLTQSVRFRDVEQIIAVCLTMDTMLNISDAIIPSTTIATSEDSDPINTTTNQDILREDSQPTPEADKEVSDSIQDSRMTLIDFEYEEKDSKRTSSVSSVKTMEYEKTFPHGTTDPCELQLNQVFEMQIAKEDYNEMLSDPTAVTDFMDHVRLDFSEDRLDRHTLKFKKSVHSFSNGKEMELYFEKEDFVFQLPWTKSFGTYKLPSRKDGSWDSIIQLTIQKQSLLNGWIRWDPIPTNNCHMALKVVYQHDAMILTKTIINRLDEKDQNYETFCLWTIKN